MARPVTSRHRGAVTALALAALVAGIVVIVVAARAQQSAPPPTRSVGKLRDATSSQPSSADGSSSPSADTGHKPLPASKPVGIRIPAIGVGSKVNELGLAEDGSLAVPQPGPHLNQAAWFDKSPTPGQPGPAIIEGHVDTENGPSVFFELGAVRPGNRIFVTRNDGVDVVFTVDAVRDYPKTKFPTTAVYGGNLQRPQLRLITCSDFDASTHHHIGNEVVFAHLTTIHRPPQLPQ